MSAKTVHGTINPLKPSGHYMYHQFNISQVYVLPTQCIYVFCVDLRTNSDYFTVQHWLVGFYNPDAVCLLRGTDWSLNKINAIFSPQNVSQLTLIYFRFVHSFYVLNL